MENNNNNAENANSGNGRNKRRVQSSKAASMSAPSCGVIEDISTFSEKLSGQHSSGYACVNQCDNDIVSELEAPIPQKSDSQIAKEENSKEEVSQSKCDKKECSVEEKSCECDSSRGGPSFEEMKEASHKRTLEVGLKKIGQKSEKAGKDAVSYASASAALDKEETKQIGIFQKIKNLLAKIFGKKTSNRRDFKNDRYSNRKNHYRNSDKKFHKDGGFKKDFHGKGRSYGNNRNRHGDFKKRSNFKSGAASAPKQD